MRLFEDFLIKEGLAVHLWPTKKFRTVYLHIYLHCQLTEENATFMNLLPAVLTRGTAEYRETRQINTRLDMLYGAGISSSFTRRGERGLATFAANMADIQCEGKTPLQHLCELVSSIMFRPALSDAKLLRSDFLATEKAGIINDIASLKDDKDSWADYRCIANMCHDEPFGIHPYGDEGLLLSIGAEPLTSWWSNCMPGMPADIFAVGDFDVIEAFKAIDSAFGDGIKGTAGPGPAATNKPAPLLPFRVEERADTAQAKLVMGWRAATNWADSRYPAHALANHIFGQYPQSRLFMNIREKEALAYSVGSRIEPTKGLVFAYAGIDPSNAEKTADLINQEHSSLSKGDITEKELTEAKKSMAMGIRMSADSPSSLCSREMTGIVNGGRFTIGEAVRRIEACKAEEVAQASSEWKLDTIFTLMPTSFVKGGRG